MDRPYAYYIECVVRIIVDCFFYVAILEMTFHMNLRALGSIPVDGSSRKIIFGLPIIAIATDSFLLFPPERVPESLFEYFSRSNYLIF